MKASAQPKLVFINRFFYPDIAATSQVLSDLAFALAAQSLPVVIITSAAPGTACRSTIEITRGVTVHRVAKTRFGHKHLFGRCIDFLAFHAAAMLALLRIARRGDVVVAMTDPPMLVVSAAAIAGWRKFKLVHWCQDLYPEIAFSLGVISSERWPGNLLRRLRDRSFRHVCAHVAIGADMAERLRSITAAPDRVTVIPNWTDDEAITPLAESPLSRGWHLDGKFVVMYSGNAGRTQDFETVFAAAQTLSHRNDVVFLFVVRENTAVDVRREMASRGLTNVLIYSSLPREALAQSLAAGQAHWLSVKSGLEDLLFPSKFFGIAAAGRPMIAVTPPRSELGRLVAQYDCGIAVDPGDGAAFAAAVIALAENPGRRAQMGSNARRMLDQQYSRQHSIACWTELLHELRRTSPDKPLSAAAQYGS